MEQVIRGEGRRMTEVRRLKRNELCIRHEIRRRKLFIISVIVFAICCTFIFTSLTYAFDNRNMTADAPGKCYRTVMIYMNDTVEGIAKEYMSEYYGSAGDLAKEIISINNISYDTKLIPGNYIIVPCHEMVSPDVTISME
ncbi:MAG: hypothetical protein K6B28_10350 [Lachnospiraceae bacterium]|nr:hypothetical protein [Lachnospiraceae bacterium]